MGDGFRVRVRVRAKGWLGFTYYGPKLLKLRLRSGGGFGKKQNRADNHSKSPLRVIVWSYCISTSNKFNTSKYVHNLVPKGMYFHGKKSLPEFTTGKWLFFYINFYSRFLL